LRFFLWEGEEKRKKKNDLFGQNGRIEKNVRKKEEKKRKKRNKRTSSINLFARKKTGRRIVSIYSQD